MGSNCSASLAKPSTCGHRPWGPLPELPVCEEECDLCEDDEHVDTYAQGEHPLLQGVLAGGLDSLPPTPRGPVPPWVAASSSQAPVDRTATGATPPRSPRPPRMTPPGLPEEEAPSTTASVHALGAALGGKFSQELFVAVRGGSAQSLSRLLQDLSSMATAQVTKAQAQQGQAQDAARAAERTEKAAELVASYLNKVRDRGATTSETLLGVACEHGHLEAVRMLLISRADALATDEEGNCALHRAAHSGVLLNVLLVLDCLQVNNRCITLAELTNADGETPEAFACRVGACDIVRAFEAFGQLQGDAELRQLGSSGSSEAAGGHRGTGGLLAYLDLAAEARSSGRAAASALLRRSVEGSRLVAGLFQRIPEDEGELRRLVDKACEGLQEAERILLRTQWDPACPSLDPAVRGFVATAQLRSKWQLLRAEAERDEAAASLSGLEEFWQTHLSAERMVSTIRNALGDTFQLLLTVLWLYTREAWLRHVLDALVITLHAASVPHSGALAAADHGVGDGATGATTSWPVDLPSVLRPVEPLVEALAPCAQLVQSALCWFEEAGIRHSAATYRPLALPMLGVQRLVDRYVAGRRTAEEQPDEAQGAAVLRQGAWLALGGGTFFSSMSSRAEATRRVSRSRCNVLLCIRPDEAAPCYPKHMMLRGSNVDDTLFPLDAMFRITRITRNMSSELDPESTGRAPPGSNVKWPVMIIELASSSRFLEAMELLEERGDLVPGELETGLEDWAEAASAAEEYERHLAAGELLERLESTLARPGAKEAGAGARPSSRAEKAAELLSRAAAAAEAAPDPEGAARALLAKARCGVQGSAAARRRAVALLEEAFGMHHPSTCAARAMLHEPPVTFRRGHANSKLI